MSQDQTRDREHLMSQDQTPRQGASNVTGLKPHDKEHLMSQDRIPQQGAPNVTGPNPRQGVPNVTGSNHVTGNIGD